jgi:GNAT superfamily N-acetyltransferase
MDEASVAAIARLHAQCLPDSLVGALGDRYVRSFYRFVDRSADEMLVVDRDDAGVPVAVAVFSLDPSTLTRRLVLGTPLLVSALRRLSYFIGQAFGSNRGGDTGRELPSLKPQLILIYTAPSERGKGRATSLIAELERRLRERGVAEYEVRTESEPSNPALAFYRARGFTPDGVSVRMGTSFQVFSRRL